MRSHSQAAGFAPSSSTDSVIVMTAVCVCVCVCVCVRGVRERYAGASPTPIPSSKNVITKPNGHLPAVDQLRSRRYAAQVGGLEWYRSTS